MSSRIRYLTQYAGRFWAGSEAKQILRTPGTPVIKSPKDFVAAAARLGAQAWVFREPRNIKFQKGRYIKLCKYIGLGRPKKKGSVLDGGLQYVLANQQLRAPRLARAPRV